MITIFTPTYNRGYIIEKLYQSLKKQTSKNFEWLVVDDGSKDNTEDIFEKIKLEKKDFKIRYVRQENGGKHRAINHALDLAKGELFFIVDSDDYLTEDAVQKIEEWIKTIPTKERYKFAGIAGNKGENKKKIVGKTFKGNFIDATSLERKKYNIQGDKAEIFFTEVFRKFKFPEFEGENFITENVVWYKMVSKNLKLRWFNEVVYICNYLEDGLTKAGRSLGQKNPKGYLYHVNELQGYSQAKFLSKYIAKCFYYRDLKEIYSDEDIKKQLKLNFLEYNSIKILVKSCFK